MATCKLMVDIKIKWWANALVLLVANKLGLLGCCFSMSEPYTKTGED